MDGDKDKKEVKGKSSSIVGKKNVATKEIKVQPQKTKPPSYAQTIKVM